MTFKSQKSRYVKKHKKQNELAEFKRFYSESNGTIKFFSKYVLFTCTLLRNHMYFPFIYKNSKVKVTLYTYKNRNIFIKNW